jgi:hypothetical protein
MHYDPRRLTPHRRQHWGVEPNAEVGGPFVDTATRPFDPAERKRLLWRDSATILIGVVIALLAAQVFLPRSTGVAVGSASPASSGLTIGASPGMASATPEIVTFGPIVDPSLGIDATPTPIPVITLPPTGTPVPGATTGPTPKPTPRITPKPTRKPPTPTPTPTPTPPPPPPPNAVVSCQTQALSLTVMCTSSSTHIQAGSESWNMGGPGTIVSGGDGAAFIEYTYDASGFYTVRLTVTGTNGTTTDSDEVGVTVAGA